MATYKKRQALTPEDVDEFVPNEVALPKLSTTDSIHLHGPQGRKCEFNGIKLDSNWELAYYLYMTELKGLSVERNHKEWLPYIDENGNSRKFHWDFTVMGYKKVEIKGIYRPADEQKKAQCPEVEFLDSKDLKPILAELNKRMPNWKERATDRIF